MDPNFQSVSQTEQPIAPVQPQAAPPQPPLPPPPPIGQRNNMLLMILGAITLLVVGLGAGYFLKSSSGTDEKQVAQVTPTQATTPTPTATLVDDTANWLSYSNAKVKNLSLKQYTIKYPPTWTPGISHTDMTDEYTLTNGSYAIKIYQAPMGGAMCIFEGEMPQGPATDLRTTKFVDVTTTEGTMFRRYLTTTPTPAPTTSTYNFCGTSDEITWGSPTAFGGITYTTPTTPDENTLTEMDAIIKTLTEVK